MQTFLSEPTFAMSAAVLDNKRLNKQLLEGRQILYAISITPDGGGSRVDGKVPFASNHPVTNQWRGYEYRLTNYLSEVKKECDRRGIQTEANWKFVLDLFKSQPWSSITDPHGWPDWYEDEDERQKVIDSHRFNLWTKDPIHYSQYESAAEKFSERVARNPLAVVCCSTHSPYWYPTHRR